MRVLLWHVHGSWTTSFVQGGHEYVLPLVDDRGPDGRGRAQTWSWPSSAVEVAPDRLPEHGVDVVVLQRPHEAELLQRWTGLRAGVDVPAVYVEHNAPTAAAPGSRHPLAEQAAIPVVHVTRFNQLMWDCGAAPTTVLEHGVVDPGPLYTGERASLGVVVNEPVRRWRVAGTDVLLRVARDVDVEVYGMGMSALLERAPQLHGRVHENLPQARMHAELARHRAYLHPYRWTSLGLALVEAMTLGQPVLALATTEAPEAVPAAAGVVTNDLTTLVRTARRWMRDPQEARERGAAGRSHALRRFGLPRFLDDWDAVFAGVVAGQEVA
ncbi:glycosyltransferase [Rhodococcus sp. X156]|uniref:glycosyltransferase n=1 Tax=Rhodococcus sp. X156 TaxID=2499145 RepID=UPI000FDC5378|nr:glycosyltransferase [Rhodococcus sp. X156]